LWPLFNVWKITRETGKKPDAKLLVVYGNRYYWLNKHIIECGMVESNPLDKKVNQPISTQPSASGFTLWLGKSTGLLSTLWHRAGMAANQQVSLTLEDACQNILVLGGIGSGKTTCVMQPLL